MKGKVQAKSKSRVEEKIAKEESISSSVSIAPAVSPAPAKWGALKMFAVLLLVALAAVSFYYFVYVYPNSSNGQNGGGAPDYAKGILADKSVFLSKLQSSGQVYLVMDLRNASELQRGYIMQCGTDFAGSTGLVGKDIVSYALEDASCTSIDGQMKLNDCINKAMGGVGIYIRSSGATAFFSDKFIIGIGGNYTAGTCRVNIIELNATQAG